MPAHYNHEIDRRLEELFSEWDGRELTLQEIAIRTGCSKTQIRNIEQSALKKIARLMPEEFRNYEAPRLGR